MPHGSVRKNSARVHAHIVMLTPGHYTSFDNAIIDRHAKTIGAIGVAIYAVLARYANRKTGECWPTIGCIARQLDLGRSTVKVYLHRLEAVGLIEIEERYAAAGDQDANRYRLLDPAPAAVEARRKARAAQALAGLLQVASPPERGRSTDDPPPEAPQTEGGRSADALPGESADSPQLLTTEEKENHARRRSVELAEETTPKTRICDHPADERLRFGEVAVCPHCWAIFETPTAPAGVVVGNRAEGREVSSAPRAA